MIDDWEAHFKRIYRTEPAKYDRLVAAEDAFGELARHVDTLAEEATTIVDVGAGTGRLTVQLCRPGNQVHGVDCAPAMLEIAKEKLADCPGEWELSVGDAGSLPVSDNWADASIAGWVYGHLTEWNPCTWEMELAAALFAAAQSDPILADVAASLNQQRHEAVRMLADAVLGDVRPPQGIARSDLADYIYATWSAPVYRQLVKERGWPIEKYIDYCILMVQRTFVADGA